MPRHTSRPKSRYSLASTPRPTTAERRATRHAPKPEPVRAARPAHPPCAKCLHPEDLHIPTETSGTPCGAHQPGLHSRCYCLGYLAPAAVGG